MVALIPGFTSLAQEDWPFAVLTSDAIEGALGDPVAGYVTVRAEFAHRANQANEMSPMQATRFMNNENAVVIDVSEVADYENGHITKAINIPMKELQDK